MKKEKPKNKRLNVIEKLLVPTLMMYEIILSRGSEIETRWLREEINEKKKR